LAVYPNNVRYVRVAENYEMDPKVSVLGVYDSIELEMEGVKE
jgi:hypothetical protein